MRYAEQGMSLLSNLRRPPLAIDFPQAQNSIDCLLRVCSHDSLGSGGVRSCHTTGFLHGVNTQPLDLPFAGERTRTEVEIRQGFTPVVGKQRSGPAGGRSVTPDMSGGRNETGRVDTMRSRSVVPAEPGETAHNAFRKLAVVSRISGPRASGAGANDTAPKVTSNVLSRQGS